MDRATVAVYDRVADLYAERRKPNRAAEARDFGDRVDGVRADLGCGPGRYTAMLGGPIVALDASLPMLHLAGAAAPGALRVNADLERLPLRPGALGGAWANHSYQHIDRGKMALALAGLHRSIAIGGQVEMTLFVGDRDGPWPDDEFPGRRFVLWPRDRMSWLLEGAGFTDITLEDEQEVVRIRARRGRTLPDIVASGMRVLVCGLNPSLYAADAGVAFARPGNRFWPAALAAGLVSRDRDPWHALDAHGIGWTDLCKRSTAAAHELDREEFVAGAARLAFVVGMLRPAAVCFVGLSGYRAAIDPRAVAGVQAEPFAGAPVYVMPNTSGLNAGTKPAGFVAHLRAAAALASGRS